MPWIGPIFKWTPEEEQEMKTLIERSPKFPLGDPRSGFVFANGPQPRGFTDAHLDPEVHDPYSSLCESACFDVSYKT